MPPRSTIQRIIDGCQWQVDRRKAVVANASEILDALAEKQAPAIRSGYPDDEMAVTQEAS
jgi:hypothetical protein